ncbi:uncharacterized protein METZ01_LOCUS31108 [marine metagenome]|uniref:Uncharacterized protein n=1 Tax=marine metagenome TaxID=408172 RepID=A0A381QH91_9ZZZZ
MTHQKQMVSHDDLKLEYIRCIVTTTASGSHVSLTAPAPSE